MYEIDLKLRNGLAFSAMSGRFPGVLIYRWCNSAVDYLEFYGKQAELDEVSRSLPEIAEALNTRIVRKKANGNRLSVMFSCRCSIENSTIRIIESKNCLWHAPVTYRGGEESIKAVSLDASDFESLYEELSRIGEVIVGRKARIEPDSLRDVYVIPLTNILGSLTDRQLKSLQEAIGRGYFSSPRRVSIGELSDSTGISKSTFQEHLSKAVNKMFYSMEPYINLMLEYRHGGRKET